MPQSWSSVLLSIYAWAGLIQVGYYWSSKLYSEVILRSWWMWQRGSELMKRSSWLRTLSCITCVLQVAMEKGDKQRDRKRKKRRKGNRGQKWKLSQMAEPWQQSQEFSVPQIMWGTAEEAIPQSEWGPMGHCMTCMEGMDYLTFAVCLFLWSLHYLLSPA